MCYPEIQSYFVNRSDSVSLDLIENVHQVTDLIWRVVCFWLKSHHVRRWPLAARVLPLPSSEVRPRWKTCWRGRARCSAWACDVTAEALVDESKKLM